MINNEDPAAEDTMINNEDPAAEDTRMAFTITMSHTTGYVH